ncbi:MAG: preprotein translocase subunit SecE [Clostridia bacterium]|jgi:preprotein translocase subunit SecE|nr:preprotein translocase subunit SecE [Clostridia bacterium]
MAKNTNNKNENKHFFKDFKAELKKVIWPTPKQVLNNTTAVITIVLVTAIIVFVLDLAFEKLNTHGIDKLKSIVKTTEENNVIEENTVLDTQENTENTENSVNNTIPEDNTQESAETE